MSVDTITVIYPVCRNGTLEHAKDTLDRRQVVAKLDGTDYAEQIRANPHVGVVLLLDLDAIKAWVSPDEWAAFGDLPDPDEEEA